jgi:uncharacterized OB-fold protein
MSQANPAQPAFKAPELSRDYQFFMDGLNQHALLVQRCSSCGTVRHPPGPVCPECHSLAWTAEALKGTGTVYSYIVHYHPPIPPYDAPHPVVLVDMDEGVRVLAALEHCPIDRIEIGMRVRAHFVEVGPNLTFHRFRPEEA